MQALTVHAEAAVRHVCAWKRGRKYEDEDEEEEEEKG